MSILAHDEIVELCAHAPVITPYRPSQVNGSSYDIRLGDTVLLEARDPYDSPNARPVIDVANRESPRFAVRKISEGGFILQPGQFVLAQSSEVFSLPRNISADFKLKSSLARSGLQHALACWCDPGWTNSVLTLELTNSLRWHALRLRPGMLIGQMVFYRHTEVPLEESYAARGRYNNDTTTQGPKK
jgi:dCTP deaminase